MDVLSRRVLRFAVLTASLAVASPGPALSQDAPSVRRLLSSQFRQSTRVSYVTVRATGPVRARIERRLGRTLARDRFTFFVARTGDRVDGYALFDDELGQHEPISLATFLDRAGRVTHVEVMAYREAYGDGIRSARFRDQFRGRSASSGFRPGRDIDAISGSTISAHSMCVAVHRAVVLLEELVLRSPAAGRTAAPSAP